MKRIKKIKRRVAALVISFFLTLGLTAPAFNFTAKAEALEVANSACSVADMIFSYCASGGVAVMNETVIDEVYNVLGSSFGTLQTFVDNGLLTYSNGQYVDSGLSTSISSAIENINSIDIGALFAQTAEQNPAGVALTGGASLAGIAGSVATTGVLPLVAGVAVTGYCGFQIGTLIANFIGLYDDEMGLGVNLNLNQDIVSNIPKGSQVIYGKEIVFGDLREYYKCANGIGYGYRNGDFLTFGFVNPYDYDIAYKNIYIENHVVSNITNSTIKARQYNGGSVVASRQGKINVPNYCSSSDDFATVKYPYWLNGGSYNRVKSPDVIGSNGNIESTFNNDTQEYDFPSISPKVNPENESVNPTGLTFDDYINYAKNAQSNYNNGNPDNNKNVYDDILNNIKIAEPTPVPEPAPEPNPDPNPAPDPETVPVPSINPYPNTYPVADPETVPENKPQPEYTEKATENETDIVEGDPYTTPDLLDKFPFCIPRDILRSFKKLDSGSREAPHIQWRFHPNEMIDYTFDVDFSTWDNVAVLLRLLELLGFIVLLGIATRNLILS